jgi:hypothetical protein
MNATARFCEEFEKPARASRRAKPMDPVDVAILDAKKRAETGEWNWSKGATFVGLYAMCHQMIYGVVPDELYTTGTFRAAARSAANALHVLFDDDACAFAEFVRWSWEREKRKHNWALAQGFDRNRMSWKLQFSRALLTDYRIAKAQRRF